MGLGQADVDSLDNESSSSGSSSSSSGSYPKFEERVPAISITCDEDGNWEYHTYPEGPSITYKKRRSNASWKRHFTPPEMQKFWWDRKDFLKHAYRVEEMFNADIWEVLDNDPERAADLITKTANPGANSESISRSRKCAVCDEKIHTATGDYREIENRIVCKRHNVEELHSAGLL